MRGGWWRANDVRLNSAVGYITPKDMLAGRQQEIHADRNRKLEEERKQRQVRRRKAARTSERIILPVPDGTT